MMIATKYAIGLDMQCRRIVTKVSLIETREPDANGLDCVIRSDDGVLVKATQAELYETADEARRQI